jgi:6-phosphogluconate dehydrogenase
MQLGMIGLGRMGANMAERLRAAGHQVIGFDPFSEDSEVESLEALVAALDPPRALWSMVPAGAPTTQTVNDLVDLLEPGDVLVEGGNSRFTDSVIRAERYGESGIGYVDAGVSGGVWGLERGYALMVGGEDEHVRRMWPLLVDLAPEGAADTGRGLAHVGPSGSGHFTKMVHNGVEYAVMQAFAEGYELLARHPLGVDVPATLTAWQEGSVIQSWLLDLLVRGLDAHPGFEDLDDVASDSGEGRWTVETAVATGVPVPAIAAALFARFESQTEESLAMKAIAALREQFGGHAVVRADDAPDTPAGEGG